MSVSRLIMNIKECHIMTDYEILWACELYGVEKYGLA